MIVPDTSVWVAAMRDATGPEARHLAELLDRDEVALPVFVRLELLSGASGPARRALVPTFEALPTIYPSSDTWSTVEEWIDTAARRGERFGILDLLIAALAARQNAAVWSLDADFERLERLRLIRRYRPAV